MCDHFEVRTGEIIVLCKGDKTTIPIQDDERIGRDRARQILHQDFASRNVGVGHEKACRGHRQAAPLNPIVIDQRRYIFGAGDMRDGIGRVRHREVIAQGDW